MSLSLYQNSKIIDKIWGIYSYIVKNPSPYKSVFQNLFLFMYGIGTLLSHFQPICQLYVIYISLLAKWGTTFIKQGIREMIGLALLVG